MKREYSTPTVEIVTYNYNEQVAASGTSSCFWGSISGFGYEGCNTGKEGWIGNKSS